MQKTDFIELLNKPFGVKPLQARELKSVINAYPYFQSARVIYLKALKDLESFRYNHELKKTAVNTRDRSVLFDFITKESFIETSAQENLAEKELIFSEEITIPVNEVEVTIDEIVEESGILIDDHKEANILSEPEQVLGIGDPLIFKRDEQFSFHKWLELSKVNKPIEREKKSEQDSIIDKFIKTSPKISKIDKNKPLEVKVQKTQGYSELMTETLAKIYLEQKKYDSAIKAYEILSLKYPEKSGFFADRINQIKNLQK